jgi:hypothetical protein
MRVHKHTPYVRIEVIHIVDKHSHIFSIHMTSHPHRLIEVIHCLILIHIYDMKPNSYQDLHILRRHRIVRVMSTTVRSIVEESLDKWVPRPTLLFTRCSHSGWWSAILHIDLIDQGIRDGFFDNIDWIEDIKYNKFSYGGVEIRGKCPRSHWLKRRWRRYCYGGNMNIQPNTLEACLI